MSFTVQAPQPNFRSRMYSTVTASLQGRSTDSMRVFNPRAGQFRLLDRIQTALASSIWRGDMGPNLQRLFPDETYAWFLRCSPDGKSIHFTSWSGNVSRLMRAQKLLEKFLIVGRYSPDGAHVTALADDGNGIYQAVLMDAPTAARSGREQKSSSLERRRPRHPHVEAKPKAEGAKLR